MMNMKNSFLLLAAFYMSLLSSCVLDWKYSFIIKNRTNDTLLIELTDDDTLNNNIYWGSVPEDTIWTTESDTTWIYMNGEKIVINNLYYAQPDSIILVGPYWFNKKDTCYIYAIKWWVATHYTLDEIRKGKLYEKRAITKADFNERLYEYKR